MLGPSFIAFTMDETIWIVVLVIDPSCIAAIYWHLELNFLLYFSVDSMLYFDHMPFTNSEKGFKLSTNGRPRICFLVALYGLAFIIPNIRWREQTPLF